MQPGSFILLHPYLSKAGDLENVWIISDISPKIISLRKHFHQNKLFVLSSWIPLSLYSIHKLSCSCCFQITTFVHVYRWLHSGIPSFIPLWLLELFPTNVLRVLFGPFFPPQEGGQWERKEGAGAWGKVPNVFKLKLQWWKIYTTSFMYFKRRAMFLLCHLLKLPSLFVLHSKLSHFLFFSHRIVAVSI